MKGALLPGEFTAKSAFIAYKGMLTPKVSGGHSLARTNDEI